MYELCELPIDLLYPWTLFQQNFQVSVNVHVVGFGYLNYYIHHSADYGADFCTGNGIVE